MIIPMMLELFVDFKQHQCGFCAGWRLFMDRLDHCDDENNTIEIVIFSTKNGDVP